MKHFLILFIAFSMSACATTKDSVWLGGTLGAVAGGVVGHKSSAGDNKTVATGIAAGAASGALISYLVSRSNKKSGSKTTEEKKDNNEDLPSLTRPEWRRIWVDDKVEDNRLIKGHFIYVIEKNSQWSID